MALSSDLTRRPLKAKDTRNTPRAARIAVISTVIAAAMHLLG
jgi:hypothetical protein